MRTDHLIWATVTIGIAVWAYIIFCNPWLESSSPGSVALSSQAKATDTKAQKFDPTDVWTEIENFQAPEYPTLPTVPAGDGSSTYSAEAKGGFASGKKNPAATDSLTFQVGGGPAPAVQDVALARFNDADNSVPRRPVAQEQPRSTRAVVHIVKKGDTLSRIAKKYLGSALKWKKIVDANAGAIKDPRRVRIGTRLVIPVALKAASPGASGRSEAVQYADASRSRPAQQRQAQLTASPAKGFGQLKEAVGFIPTGATAPSVPQRSYVVTPGDTLSSISRKFYGTTRKWRKILEANRGNVENDRKLYVGTRIQIP